MIARICGWRPYLLAAVLIGALAALWIPLPPAKPPSQTLRLRHPIRLRRCRNTVAR